MAFSITLSGINREGTGPSDVAVAAAYADLVHVLRRAAPEGAPALIGAAVTGTLHLTAGEVPYEQADYGPTLPFGTDDPEPEPATDIEPEPENTVEQPATTVPEDGTSLIPEPV